MQVHGDFGSVAVRLEVLHHLLRAASDEEFKERGVYVRHHKANKGGRSRLNTGHIRLV